jgi:hypothetical protein
VLFWANLERGHLAESSELHRDSWNRRVCHHAASRDRVPCSAATATATAIALSAVWEDLSSSGSWNCLGILSAKRSPTVEQVSSPTGPIWLPCPPKEIWNSHHLFWRSQPSPHQKSPTCISATQPPAQSHRACAPLCANSKRNPQVSSNVSAPSATAATTPWTATSLVARTRRTRKAFPNADKPALKSFTSLLVLPKGKSRKS